MKNKFTLILIILALFITVAGCSLGGLMGGDDSSETGSTTEESGDKSDKKSTSSGGDVLDSGIAECDELAKYVNDNAEEIESTFVGKALVLVYKNTVLNAIEEGFEKMDEKQKENWKKICTKSLKELKEKQEEK